jgi:hypothetical protein
VWRFRRAMFNDFRARMDWCVKTYDQANHHPVAAFNGDTTDSIVQLKSAPGEMVELDASASTDPDQDGLGFQWWMYREAGTYSKRVAIPDDAAAVTVLTIPEDAGGSQIHLIMEVQDCSEIVPLYDYRRIVIYVVGSGG